MSQVNSDPYSTPAQGAPPGYGPGAAPAGYDATGQPQPTTGYTDPAAAQPGYSAPTYGAPGYPPPGYPAQGYYPPGYPPPVDPYAKSKLAAGLLSIFLGIFGVGRFYLGYTGVGVVQLVLCFLSFGIVPVIWGLIEGIMILAAAPGTRWAYDASGRPLRA